MNNKSLWIAVVVVAIIALIGVVTPTGKTVLIRTVGALSGPDIQSEYLSVNGVSRYFYNVGLTQATSTICAIKSPAATSTLISGSVHVDVNTTASTAVIGKATTAYATTTKLAQVSIAAGTELNLVASTSPITSGANTFSPNNYMVVSLEGSGAVNLGGECHATFEQLTD